MVVSRKALACALPATLGVPLARLHVPDLKAEMIARGVVAEISDMTIWRWLSEDAIRPWRQRSWIFPRDPDFEAKAALVLDLYARRWRRKPLGPRDFVISADEKTSVQARVRCHQSAAPAPGRDMRVEHEYDRGGALAYLAAWDVHRARVFGRCEPKAGIEPFDGLVEQVMTTQPYASARRVFWVGARAAGVQGRAQAAHEMAPRNPCLPPREPHHQRPARGSKQQARCAQENRLRLRQRGQLRGKSDAVAPSCAIIAGLSVGAISHEIAGNPVTLPSPTLDRELFRQTIDLFLLTHLEMLFDHEYSGAVGVTGSQ